MPSRRQFLGTTAVGVTALAGCSNIGGAPTMLDLTVTNGRQEPDPLTISFLRTDVDDRSNPMTYHNDIEVSPGASEWKEPDVVEQRPYRIELSVGPQKLSRHYHYQPDCSADDTEYDIGVSIEIREDGVSVS